MKSIRRIINNFIYFTIKIGNERQNDTEIISGSFTALFYFAITVPFTRIVSLNLKTKNQWYSTMIHKDPIYTSCSFHISLFIFVERENDCKICAPLQTDI